MKRKNGEGSWGTKTIKGQKYVYFRDSSGKYFYGKNEKEVREKTERHRRIEGMAKSVSDIEAKPSTTFYNYISSYIESIKLTLQPYTYYNYAHMVKNLVFPHKIARKQLGQITPDMITAYYADLAKDYSYGTILSINKILKGPLGAAEADGLIRPSTAKKVKLPKERYCKPTEKSYVPKVEEMKQIEDLCMRVVPRSKKYKMKNNGLFFVVILHTGLRIGELIALHWDDVNMNKRTIHVNKSASFKEVNGVKVYDEKDPKSSSSNRIIPFDDVVYDIFVYLKENYPKDKDIKSGHVFLNRNGTHMTKSTLEQSFNVNIRDKMGIAKMTPHSLRHAYGSYLALMKVNPKVIMKLMGHSRLNITYEVYVEGYEDELIEAANMFSKNTKD